MQEELVVLKKILDDPEARKKVRALLKFEHFTDPANRFIYKIINTFNGADGPISLLSIQTFIKKKNFRRSASILLFDRIGRLSSIGAVLSSDLDFNIDVLVNNAKSKKILGTIQDIADDIFKNNLKDAEEKLKNLPGDLSSFEIFDDKITSLRTLSKLKPDKKVDCLSTGFQRIDELTGGGRKTEFWLWAAYVSEFKSTSLLCIAHHLMLNKKNVFFVSMEMNDKELKRRLFCMHSLHLGHQITYRDIEFGITDKNKLNEKKQITNDFDNNPEYGVLKSWIPPANASIDDVWRKLEGMSSRTKFDVLILDYIQKLSPIRKRQDRRTELNETLDRVKRFAMEANSHEGILIFSGYQTSREGRKKAGEKGHYDLWDLSDSSGAEQNANVVCWSLQTEKMKKNNEVKIGIAKSRNSSMVNSQHFIACDLSIGLFSRTPTRTESDTDIDNINQDDFKDLME